MLTPDECEGVIFQKTCGMFENYPRESLIYEIVKRVKIGLLEEQNKKRIEEVPKKKYSEKLKEILETKFGDKIKTHKQRQLTKWIIQNYERYIELIEEMEYELLPWKSEEEIEEEENEEEEEEELVEEEIELKTEEEKFKKKKVGEEEEEEDKELLYESEEEEEEKRAHVEEEEELELESRLGELIDEMQEFVEVEKRKRIRRIKKYHGEGWVGEDEYEWVEEDWIEEFEPKVEEQELGEWESGEEEEVEEEEWEEEVEERKISLIDNELFLQSKKYFQIKTLISIIRNRIHELREYYKLDRKTTNNLIRHIIIKKLDHLGYKAIKRKHKKDVVKFPDEEERIKKMEEEESKTLCFEIICFKKVLKKLLGIIGEQEHKLGILQDRANFLKETPSWHCDEEGYIPRNAKKWEKVTKLSKTIAKKVTLMNNWMKEHLPEKYPEQDAYGDDECKRGHLHLDSTFIWKYADQSHSETIEKLKNDQSKVLFGDTDVKQLIEHASLSIILYDKSKVVGFIAVNDYPNISCIPLHDWKEYMDCMFGLPYLEERDTRFIHLLVWDEEYEKTLIISALLIPVFQSNGFIKRVLILPPPGSYMGEFLREYFKRINVLLIKSQENPFPPVFSTPRYFHLPQWKFRELEKNDSRKLRRTLTENAPELLHYYGQHVIEQIRMANDPHRQFFVALEDEAAEDSMGFISFSDEIDFNVIQMNFDTKEYNGFRKSTVWDNQYEKEFKKATYEGLDKTAKSILKSALLKSLSTAGARNKNIEALEDKKIQSQLSAITSWPTRLYNPEMLPEVENITSHEIDELNITKYITDRNLCLLADTRGNSVLRNKPYKSSPDINNYAGKSDAFSVEAILFPKNQDKREACTYITQGFIAHPDIRFLLMLVPRGKYDSPLLDYMKKVDRVCSTFPYDLFTVHASILFADFNIREANLTDLEDIICLTVYTKAYKEIQREIFDALQNRSRIKAQVIILMADQVTVGFAVVCQELDIEFLRYHYNLDSLAEMDLHKGDEHGFIKYFILNDLYRMMTRHYIRAIMRMTNYTSLYCYDFPVIPASVTKFYSLVLGLEYWVPVRPRSIPDYWTCFEKVSVNYIQDVYPFSLFYLNYRLASIEKRFFHDRIVVVGSGELGLSFLETIFFEKHYGIRSLVDITLVTMSGLPNKRAIPQDIERMISYNGRYNAHFIKKIPLFPLAKIVYGKMIEIRRSEKLIVVFDFDDGKNKFIEYDYLFLFCGEQYVTPAAEIPDTFSGCKAFYNDRASFLKKYSVHPKNLFTINSYEDAFGVISFLLKIISELNDDKNADELGKIIIYGCTVSALSFASRLTADVDQFPIGIVLIEPTLTSDCVDSIQHKQIYEDARKIMRDDLDFQIYSAFNFKGWVLEDNYIHAVYFESVTNVIKIPCTCLVSFNPKMIYHETALAIIDAGLAFNGKLLINQEFLTSDCNIYAAGSLTKYRARYANVYNHVYYNSTEIGKEVAKCFLGRLLKNGQSSNSGEFTKTYISDFLGPKIQYGHFPGGFNYLSITKPKSRFYMQCSLDSLTDIKVLETGNFEVHPGYFRIILDENNTIEDILCFTKNEIPVNNYIQLFRKQERLLNSLLIRYASGKISDLYKYFNEGWAFAIYHDRFSILQQSINDLFYNLKSVIAWTAAQAIVVGLSLENYKELASDDQQFTDKLLIPPSDLRVCMEATVYSFLHFNSVHLPMFVNPEKAKKLYDSKIYSMILEDPDLHLGEKPLYGEDIEDIKVTKEKVLRHIYVPEHQYIKKGKEKIEETIKKLQKKKLSTVCENVVTLVEQLLK